MDSSIAIVIGYIIGSIITMIIFRFFLVGSLRIDWSDPIGGPNMFLELDKSIWSVTNKSHVMLRVKQSDRSSHE